MYMSKCSSRLIALVIIVVLIVSMVGCKQEPINEKEDGVVQGKKQNKEKMQGNEKETDGEENDLLNPVGTFPIAKEKTKLSLLMAQDTLVEDYETNGYTKWLEDRCNIDLEFHILPATDAKDKLAIMISSNQKLPDVVNIGLNMMETYKYGSAGVFIPLNDFYETQSFYIKQQIEDHPEAEIIRFTQAPDGNLYSIPSYYYELHSEVRYKYWINKTWLDEVGRSEPKTTDEFYEVLKDFKYKDPNKNGERDEIPLVGGTGGGSGGDTQDPTVFLMNSFVYDDNEDHFLVDNGELSVAYTTEAWREGLRYMNKLVEDDLLSPLSFTQDDSQLRAMVNNPDECIVGTFAFMSLTLLPKESPYYDDFIGLSPLKGPDGISFASYRKTLPTNRWFITRDCENPELAFRVGDAMFNEDSFIRGRYGVEGVDWEPAEPGIPAVYDGYETLIKQKTDIWTKSQNSHWRNNSPAFTTKVMQSGEWEDLDPLLGRRRIAVAVMDYFEHIPEEGTYVPVLQFTEDEFNQISEIRSTLQTYVNECKVRFITGDMDVDKDWDSYLDEIDRIGLDKFLEISQIAYDRMYK